MTEANTDPPTRVATSEGLGNAEDDECRATPRVTDPPADLWLVHGELEHDDTLWNCCREVEVSWCEDKQYDSDVHYVRGDRYDDAMTALTGMVTLLETLSTKGESRYCYVEGRGGQMVHVADVIDAARALGA